MPGQLPQLGVTMLFLISQIEFHSSDRGPPNQPLIIIIILDNCLRSKLTMHCLHSFE